MNKEVARKLVSAAEEAARRFSLPDREFNHLKETFEVDKVVILSELSAAVVFKKTSGKKSLAFFYYLKSQEGHWRYFFISESHLLGLNKLEQMLQDINQFNHIYNFNKFEKATLY